MSVEELERRLRGAIVERKERVGKRVDLPVYSVTNSGGIQTADKTFAKQVYSRELANYKVLRKGWYAYNPSRVDVGSLARNELDTDGCISPFYTVFELTDPGIHSEFFRHFVFSRRFNERVNANLQGSVRDVLTFGALEAFPLYLPPYPEQSAIAEVLQSIEATMARKRGLIAQLERTADAVFQDALYPGGVPRFPLAKFGDAIESTKYGTSVKAGKHSEGYAVLGIPNIVARRVNEDALNRIELSENEAKKYSLRSGDLLAVRTNGNPEYVGRMALIRGPMPTTIFASYLIRIRLKKSVALPEYIEACAPRWPLRISLTKSATTSAGNFNINTDGISQAKIILPPIDVQQQVVKLERAFQDRIEAESRTLTELQNTHRALSQELLSGRLRLPASMIARFENAPPSGKTSEAVTA